jgi:hypothetical protein
VFCIAYFFNSTIHFHSILNIRPQSDLSLHRERVLRQTVVIILFFAEIIHFLRLIGCDSTPNLSGPEGGLASAVVPNSLGWNFTRPMQRRAGQANPEVNKIAFQD